MDAQRQAQLKATRKAQLHKAAHGTVRAYQGWACRCSPCRAAWSAYSSERRSSHPEERGTTASRERRRARQNAVLADQAARLGQQWTGPELEIVATRTDLTNASLATMLGRSLYAVKKAKQKVRTDPKWTSVAGVSAV